LHADIPALCGKLASLGLKITTGRNRQHLLQYLNDSIVEKRINSFPRTGWNEIDGKVAFVLPGQDNVIVDGAAVSPYEQAGTLEDWQRSIGRLVAGHSRPMFAVATANGEGGGFNFRGSSSIGKTTALRAAASVWGRANEHGIIRTLIQLGVLPWEAGTVATATEEMFRAWHLDRGNDPGEVRNALAQIRGLLEQHVDSRFDSASGIGGDKLPVRDRLGWVRGEGNGRQWLIPTQTWKETFCKGFDSQTIARAFVERGMILPDPHGRSSRSERVGKDTNRVYILTAKVLEGS
jgi:hypothetical protein